MDMVVLTETKPKGQRSAGLGQYITLASGVHKECRVKQRVAIMVKKKFKNIIQNGNQ